MKAKEFIKMIEKKMKTGEEEIKFESYEWRDDLEYCEYAPRDFDGIHRKNDVITISTSR